MTLKGNPTAIGLFVFGALILIVAGVMFLSPDVGEDRERYQLYFEGSVKGLDVGAPVLIKGVRVGVVRDIRLRMDDHDEHEPASYLVPVIIELSRRHLTSGQQNADLGISDLIQQGLRAQLELDSFVTQKLFVELGFRPDTEATFHADPSLALQEIPTVQTAWQELQANLEDVDIAQVVAKASLALDGINRVLDGPEIIRTLTALEQSLININQLAIGFNEDRERLTESLQSTLSETRETFADTQNVLREMDRLLESGNALMGDAPALIQQIEGTLNQADQVMSNLNALTNDESPTVYRIEVALDEIADTASALRRFLEVLERKPDALLRGM